MQLQATLRTITGKQVNAYRKKDIIPGVLYGKHLASSVNIFFQKNAFLKLYKESGKSQPFEIVGDGFEYFVLVHDISLHPVYTTLSHVDFLVVKKGEVVGAQVEIRLINESLAEKNKTGRINKILNFINVVAIPTKLPKYIDVDISLLKSVHDVLFVKDLVLPKDVRIDSDYEQPVVTVVDLGSDSVDSVVVNS